MRPRPGRLGAAALAVLLALALAGVLAPTFGWRLDVVQSGSMSPAIGVGDLVITTPCDADSIHAGDVVCFRSGNTLVCHRVISVNGTDRTLITKGDANEVPDPSPVAFDNVIGRVVVNVPCLGYIVSFIKGPFGWALIILLALLIMVAGGEGRDPKKKDLEGGKA